MNYIKLLGAYAIFTVAASAQAQMSDFAMSPVQFPSAISSTIHPNVSVSSSTRSISVPVEELIASKVERLPAASFEYEPSMSRRKTNMAKIVKSMKSTDAAAGAELENILANSDIINQLDQMMRPMGLRADNVADCYAVYWIAAWEASRNRDMGSSTAMHQAVKVQAENAMTAISGMQNASDAAKQEFSEALLMQATMILSAKENFGNNPTQQAALAKAVNQGAKKMGLDLTTMDLTENGFVPRSGKRSDASDAVDSANPGEAGSALAANDPANDNATSSDTGKLALYGVGGVALLAGMFALGKSFGGKG